MKGHLHLVCARREDGVCYLREQSFRAPMHLSKPHVDEGSLVVNLVTPTAGVFDNDEIDFDITVERNAGLVLTTPSSSRVYRSRDGGAGRVHQRLKVAPDASLEYYPEPFIPHAGARYHQQNSIHVAPGGSLIFFEWLSPGRVASGESFQYEELCWDTDVWADNSLVARERYRLRPDDDSLHALRLPYPDAHYLACFFLSASPFPQAEVEALGSEAVYLGWAPLVRSGWSIKAICRDALTTRQTLQKLRQILYTAQGRKPPALGRF